jgi:hypothetical protein
MSLPQTIPQFQYIQCEPGSSVIVSGYGLDDRAIEVRSPAEAKGFFLYPLCPDRLTLFARAGLLKPSAEFVAVSFTKVTITTIEQMNGWFDGGRINPLKPSGRT